MLGSTMVLDAGSLRTPTQWNVPFSGGGERGTVTSRVASTADFVRGPTPTRGSDRPCHLAAGSYTNRAESSLDP